MISPHPNAESKAQPGGFRFAAAFRFIGFLVCAGLTILFGLIPFVFGVIAQGVIPRSIPPYVVGPLASVLFFVLWRLTGRLSFVIGTGVPVWPSVAASLVLFVAFFASGAVWLRELLPRRFSTPPSPATEEPVGAE